MQSIVLQDFKKGEFNPRLQVASCFVPAKKTRLFFADLLDALSRLPVNKKRKCSGADHLLSLIQHFLKTRNRDSLDTFSFQHIIIQLALELDVDTKRYPDASNICIAFWNFLSMDGTKDGDFMFVNIQLYMKDVENTFSPDLIEALYHGRKLDMIASKAEKTGISVMHEYSVEFVRKEGPADANELLEDLKRYMCSSIPSTTLEDLHFIDELMDKITLHCGNSRQLYPSSIVSLLSSICFPQHEKMDHRDMQQKLSYFFKHHVNDFRRIMNHCQEHDHDTNGLLDWRCFQNILYNHSSVYLCRFEVAQLAALLSRSQSEIISLQVNYENLNRVVKGEILSMPLLRYRMRKLLKARCR